MGKSVTMRLHANSDMISDIRLGNKCLADTQMPEGADSESRISQIFKAVIIQTLCKSLSLFLAIFVFSLVALIYLTVIIYVPAEREIEFSAIEQPAICKTVDRVKVHSNLEACSYSSCSEWCLSKGAVDCLQLYVNVRNNGSNLVFEDCEFGNLPDLDRGSSSCPSVLIDDLPAIHCREHLACGHMNAVFQCDDGVCRNLTANYDCAFEYATADTKKYPEWDKYNVHLSLMRKKRASGASGRSVAVAHDIWHLAHVSEKNVIDCKVKKNCIELTGMFTCVDGRCIRLDNWQCKRKCPPLTMETSDNVVVLAGDMTWIGQCRQVTVLHQFDGHSVENVTLNRHDGGRRRVVDPLTGTRDLFVVTCTHLVRQHGSLVAIDCLDMAHVGKSKSGNVPFNQILANYEKRLRSVPFSHVVPSEAALTIFDRAHLAINKEGCVNTLQRECDAFFSTYGHPGHNGTTPAIFPCYYTPQHPNLAVLHYQPMKTRWMSIVFFTVPAVLLILSTTCLYVCSRVMKVDDGGKLRTRRLAKNRLPSKS